MTDPIMIRDIRKLEKNIDQINCYIKTMDECFPTHTNLQSSFVNNSYSWHTTKYPSTISMYASPLPLVNVNTYQMKQRTDMLCGIRMKPILEHTMVSGVKSARKVGQELLSQRTVNKLENIVLDIDDKVNEYSDWLKSIYEGSNVLVWMI
jgi:hypothetical protein